MTMPRRAAPKLVKRRPLCIVCRKRVAQGELHFRAGPSWLHIRCYDQWKAQPERKRPA
jgi:hypothetical protein